MLLRLEPIIWLLFGQGILIGTILLTGWILVIGIAMQDTGENAIAELELDKIRLQAPVFHGDTLYAYSQVLGIEESERDDAGIVHFKHWGVNQDERTVFEGERKVLVKRRSHHQ